MKKKENSEDAYSLILQDIINGLLKQGSVVTESSLAEKYNISRTPVREALNILVCEGLIVTSNRTKRIYSLSPSDIKEIFELKELIEGNVVYQAAKNITDDQKEVLQGLVREMASLKNVVPKNFTESKEYLNKWLLADRQFHSLLFHAARNSRAQQVIAKLNMQWHRLKIGISALEGRIGYAIPEHEAIASAVMNHDPDKARNEMVNHLENLKNHIVRLMEFFGS